MSQGLREIHSIQKISNVSLIWVVSEVSDERPHLYINASMRLSVKAKVGIHYTLICA